MHNLGSYMQGQGHSLIGSVVKLSYSRYSKILTEFEFHRKVKQNEDVSCPRFSSHAQTVGHNRGYMVTSKGHLGAFVTFLVSFSLL